MKALFKSSYAKDVLTLMTGTTVAQFIPIAITPFLSRFFSPEEFGVFALYTSILYVLSVVVSGRYEFAILLPEQEEDGFSLVVLSCILAIIFSCFLLLVSLIFKSQIASLLNTPAIEEWLLLIPLSIFIMAILQAFNYFINRKRQYKILSLSRVYRSLNTSAVSLAGGFWRFKPGGLIVGDLIGQAVAAIFLIRTTYRQTPQYFKNIEMSRVKAMAIRYVNFPRVQVFSGLFEKVAGQAPVFLLATFFAGPAVGFFSLSQRIIISPSSLISGAMGDVFRQQASEAFIKEGNALRVFKATFKRLALIAIIPFFVGYFIVEPVFTFVLGKEWVIAGQYAKIMVPMFFLQFIVSPLSVMFVIAEKQRYDLLMQIGLFCGCSGAFLLANFYGKDEIFAIQMFTLVYCIKYIIEFLLAYRFARNLRNSG